MLNSIQFSYTTKSKPLILLSLGPICNDDIILAIKYYLIIFYGKIPLLSTNLTHFIAWTYFFQFIVYTSAYDPDIPQSLLLLCMGLVSNEFSTINLLEKIPNWQ